MPPPRFINAVEMPTPTQPNFPNQKTLARLSKQTIKTTNQIPRNKHRESSQKSDIENAIRQTGIKNFASPQKMVNVLAHHSPNPPQCAELNRQKKRNSENEKRDIAIPSFTSHVLFICIMICLTAINEFNQ